jgi:hypothetical protein
VCIRGIRGFFVVMTTVCLALASPFNPEEPLVHQGEEAGWGSGLGPVKEIVGSLTIIRPPSHPFEAAVRLRRQGVHLRAGQASRSPGTLRTR